LEHPMALLDDLIIQSGLHEKKGNRADTATNCRTECGPST